MRSGAIRNGQAFQKLLEREVLLLEKCDMFFQGHPQIFAGALCRSLGRYSHGAAALSLCAAVGAIGWEKITSGPSDLVRTAEIRS